MQPLRTLGSLILMIYLCDADGTCPLTLTPPVVIGEHGESVMVNCSSTLLDHEGLYWKIRNIVSDLEEDENVISESLELADWNMTAECKIKLTKTAECSKDLEIIVYKNPDLYIFPTSYTDLEEGMQYELQCDIIEVAPVQNLTVRWYKGKQIIKTETFTDATKRPVEVSSMLMFNLSRGDHGAEFWCEAQLDFGLQGVTNPVNSKVHRVSVLYAPKFKSNKVIDNYYLEEGSNVSLSCEAEGNPPPVFSWTRDGVNLLEKTSHLNLTLEDSAIYNCTASNQLGNITKQTSVQVFKIAKIDALVGMTTPEASTPTYQKALTSDIPQTSAPTFSETAAPTSVDVSTQEGCPLMLTPSEIVVKFGDPASVNCSTSAPDAFLIGWESAIGGTGVQKPPAVTWMAKKLDQWDIEPKCFLTKQNNEQCIVMPVVTLYKTPDFVSVSEMGPGPMVEGKNFLLTCHVINVAPVRNLKLMWYQGNKAVHMQTFNNTGVTPVNVSSDLKIIPKREYNGVAFICQAELHLGPSGPEAVPTVTSSPYIADVLYPPLFKEESDHVEVTSGESVTLNCSAKGNPSPKIHWKYPRAANVKEITRGRQRDIIITEATSTNAGVYICNATNDAGTVTRSVTVTMRSKTAAGFPLFIWVLLIPLVVLTLIIIIIIFRKQQKKNGQYSFVSSQGTDNIPMTNKPEA
ncbi:intercellular adhesion molecule 5 [Cheilinus undulatus]|uniref:intercellular adhesion molecule 5 n=1 Tax=Cheilinus undulatus TaxID=241271 RepID=UPI001BD54D0C|nr:intercellular adhesion molecule 5 [Cheilinus undulatus]